MLDLQMMICNEWEGNILLWTTNKLKEIKDTKQTKEKERFYSLAALKVFIWELGFDSEVHCQVKDRAVHFWQKLGKGFDLLIIGMNGIIFDHPSP